MTYTLGMMPPLPDKIAGYSGVRPWQELTMIETPRVFDIYIRSASERIPMLDQPDIFVFCDGEFLDWHPVCGNWDRAERKAAAL